jgi:hypothetical protein
MSFDLFHGLGQLSKGYQQWYDRLTPEDQKTASPFVIGRWMVGTTDRAQLIRLNTVFNPYLFSLGQEKSLLFKLLAAGATGNSLRYQWMKAPPLSKTVKLKLEVIKQYYDVSSREAGLFAANISNDDVLEMAEELGYEKDEMSKLKKEVGDGSRSVEKPSKGKKKSS